MNAFALAGASMASDHLGCILWLYCARDKLVIFYFVPKQIKTGYPIPPDEPGQAFPKNAERSAQVGMFQKGVIIVNL